MTTNSTTAPEGATTLTTKPDAEILAAWGPSLGRQRDLQRPAVLRQP